MILASHGLQRTQDEIATVMHTGPSGTTTQDQVAAYGALANGRYSGALRDKPTFDAAKQEIDQVRSLKSGIPGHARALAGWKISQTDGGPMEQFLYVYDPWPPKQGQVYWEDWTAVMKVHPTNFIFVLPA
jgi:hypothetical protein